MNLTNPEKLILIMLAEIHNKLGIKNDINTELLTNAIYTGNTWALSWEMQGIVGDSPDETPPLVKDVVDILDMWSFIEEAYETFSSIEKEKLEAEFGVKFNGFDGNNETELWSIAEFMVKDMGRFSRFQNRDLNSHCPSIDAYRRMLVVFEPIRKTLVDHKKLSLSQISDVFRARYNRES